MKLCIISFNYISPRNDNNIGIHSSHSSKMELKLVIYVQLTLYVDLETVLVGSV